MDNGTIRRVGRIILIGTCAVCMLVLFDHMRTPLGASQHVVYDAVFQSLFMAPVIGATLLVGDVLLGWIDRHSDGARRALAQSVAVVVTAIVLSAGLTGLVLHEAPTVTVPAAQGRSELDGMLDRLVTAAGTDPADLAGIITRLSRQGRGECRDGRNRLVGQFLQWTDETTTRVPDAALGRTAYGVLALRPETMAAAARMVELLRAEGYIVDDDSSSTAISFSAFRAPEAPSVHIWARLEGTSNLVTSIRASSACLRQDR